MEEITLKVQRKDGYWTVNGKTYSELDYSEKLMLQEFMHHARQEYQESILPRTTTDQTSFESKN